MSLALSPSRRYKRTITCILSAYSCKQIRESIMSIEQAVDSKDDAYFLKFVDDECFA